MTAAGTGRKIPVGLENGGRRRAAERPRSEEPAQVPTARAGALDAWDHRVAGAPGRLRRGMVGDYEVDEFGFDRELTEAAFLPVLRPLYRTWFRVDVFGIENVPDEGAALV